MVQKYIISDLQNTIVNGDCLEELKKLPDQSVDLIFTSPPYFNARPEYSEYDSYELYLAFINDLIRECKRVLIEGKFFIINTSHVIVAREKRSTSSKRFAIPFDVHKLFMDEDFEFIDDIIWTKPEGAGCGRGRRFNIDRKPMQYKTVPIAEYVMVYRKTSDKLLEWFVKNHPDQNAVEESKINGDYEATNVWLINPRTDKDHPAVFPHELANRIIKLYSFKNDVVLDPFGGSGTVGEVAFSLGRRFVLIEKDKGYFDVIKNKLGMWVGQ
jgi:DNA modification methylase